MSRRAGPRRPAAGTCRPHRGAVAPALPFLLACLVVLVGAGGPERSVDRAYGAGDGAALGAAASAGEPTIRELVGQKFVVAMHGRSPSPALLARIRRGEVGGVILFGANIESRAQLARAVAAMQGAARASGRPPLLIATDQEGGDIRRVPWAGPTLPASELGRLSPARIRQEARAAGQQLRSAGINVDLAPVADVPAPGSFMALEHRTFASDTNTVAAAVAAFAQGLGSARVAPALKHFPGIGRATRNTDRTAVALPATLAELTRTDLLPFRRAYRGRSPARHGLERHVPGARREAGRLVADESRRFFDGRSGSTASRSPTRSMARRRAEGARSAGWPVSLRRRGSTSCSSRAARKRATVPTRASFAPPRAERSRMQACVAATHGSPLSREWSAERTRVARTRYPPSTSSGGTHD